LSREYFIDSNELEEVDEERQDDLFTVKAAKIATIAASPADP
jgi:hypothetical protein